MLTDEEIEQLAQSHLRATERAMMSSTASIRLELVKLCELDAPSGVYYGTQLKEPVDGVLLGTGGFFVDRDRGRVQEFGSGELSEACRAENPRGWGDLAVTPAVVRFLLTHHADEVLSRRSWWQFWR